jgi:hypothetical protein
MIYKNLQDLTVLADNLITYVESGSETNEKRDAFTSIVFLFEIEKLFDLSGRGLFKDEEGFDLESVNDAGYQDAYNQIQGSMDRIRSKMEDLVNKYGKEDFKRQYESLRKEEWIQRM